MGEIPDFLLTCIFAHILYDIFKEQPPTRWKPEEYGLRPT